MKHGGLTYSELTVDSYLTRSDANDMWCKICTSSTRHHFSNSYHKQKKKKKIPYEGYLY
jgi:hypothetical protein